MLLGLSNENEDAFDREAPSKLSLYILGRHMDNLGDLSLQGLHGLSESLTSAITQRH